MGDATSNTSPSNTSPSKVHAFFKQHKRKQAADFKGADVAPKKTTNTQADDAARINDTNGVTPSTSSRVDPPNNKTADGTRHDDFVIEDTELAEAETRTNAISEYLMPPLNDNEISDEELEYHLSHLERESIQIKNI